MAAHPAQAHLSLVSSHADTTPTTADQFAFGDLDIDICPRGYDWWRGTAAQLQAEGLIPEGFEWPRGNLDKSWNDGTFEYWLRRRRPEGFKGPLPDDLDSWAVRRTLLARGRDGLGAAQVYEKSQELALELWRQTPAYNAHLARYWAAHQDQTFQAFKAIFVPQPKKRSRPRKSSTTQGAQQ